MDDGQNGDSEASKTAKLLDRTILLARNVGKALIRVRRKMYTFNLGVLWNLLQEEHYEESNVIVRVEAVPESWYHEGD